MHDNCAGYYVDLMEVLDPHTVAGLLKLHFREQKSSLIPRGQPLIEFMANVKSQDVSVLAFSPDSHVWSVKYLTKA